MRSMLPLLLVAIVGAGLAGSRPSSPAPTAERVPVVVELFTSEGCSSCPPADALLTSLNQQPIANAEVIALGEHVDYWNELGWKDRFSSHQFSARQEQYADRFRLDSVYTPQMVIDGQSEFVGNDPSRAQRAIEAAIKAPKPVSVSLHSDGVTIDVEIATAPNGANVVLALTEDGLTTRVEAGENSGRELKHSAVVRRLRVLGSVADGSFKAHEKLSFDSVWARDRMKAVVFVQEKNAGRILGAAAIPLK